METSVNKVPMYNVYLREYERGWGSKLIATKPFHTALEAMVYADKYNRENNNLSYVPDEYIKAELGFHPKKADKDAFNALNTPIT
jgi:hypothetical protein